MPWQWGGLSELDEWLGSAPAALGRAVLETMAQVMENADLVEGEQYDERPLVRSIDVPGTGHRIVFLRVVQFRTLVFHRVEHV